MSRRRTLEKRVDRIHFMDPDETNVHLESAATQAWIVVHLTGDEQAECARYLKAENHDKLNEVMRLGAERAANEPTQLKALFLKKQIRAGAIRSCQRKLTEAEGDELHALNCWLERHNHWSSRKQCLVPLIESETQEAPK